MRERGEKDTGERSGGLGYYRGRFRVGQCGPLPRPPTPAATYQGVVCPEFGFQATKGLSNNSKDARLGAERCIWPSHPARTPLRGLALVEMRG